MKLIRFMLLLPILIVPVSGLMGCAADTAAPATEPAASPEEEELRATSFEKQLKDAVKGMDLISESDAPYTPIKASIGKADKIDAALVTAKFASSKLVADQQMEVPMAQLQVEEVDFAEWFSVDPADLADPRIDAEQKNQMRKRAALGKLLTKNLSDRHVFRFSQGPDTGAVLIFLVGRAPGNKLMGCFTVAVET